MDLRKKGWKTKDSATKGPTTLEEVRAQVRHPVWKCLRLLADNSIGSSSGT